MNGSGPNDSGDRVVYATGAKREPQTGKGRYDLISPFAMDRLARRYEIGVEKYDDTEISCPNMRRGMPANRFVDSGLRHLFKHLSGDRSEDHLAAGMWNMSEAMHTEELIKRGVLPEDLDNLAEIVGLKQPPVRAGILLSRLQTAVGADLDEMGAVIPCPRRSGEPDHNYRNAIFYRAKSDGLLVDDTVGART